MYNHDLPCFLKFLLRLLSKTSRGGRGSMESECRLRFVEKPSVYTTVQLLFRFHGTCKVPSTEWQKELVPCPFKDLPGSGGLADLDCVSI